MTTVTDHRVTPVTFLFWTLYRLERFVVIDGDETSATAIALYLDEATAGLEAQRLGKSTIEE